MAVNQEGSDLAAKGRDGWEESPSPLVVLGWKHRRTLHLERAPAHKAGGRGFEPRHTDPEPTVLPPGEAPSSQAWARQHHS